MIRREETICAPATPVNGPIAVIRISGPQSLTICEKIFNSVSGDKRISKQSGYTVLYGDIIEGTEIIDDVLLTIFRSPQSYTGEDSAEISCHGSPYIVKKILEMLIRYGATAAMPGEFTQRAFMNGKMDLSQAEAVADVIASSTRAAHKIAVNQMRGGFSSEISKLRAGLLHFTSLIELELDFGEEDVEFADRNDLKTYVNRVKDLADRLASSFATGNAIKNGIPVAIVGRPNTGKSTLLNALIMEERAIVSEIPGTTRDAIEDTMFIDGVEYRFIDTAGLRKTSDLIESLGIRKTHEKIFQASVILLVDEVNEKSELINEGLQEIRTITRDMWKKIIVLINKTDLAGKLSIKKLKNEIKLNSSESLLFISAKNKSGLDELRMKLREAVNRDRLDSDDVIITNIRHYDALMHVSESLERVQSGLENNIPEDLIAIDIRQAIHYLGEITGEITTDEILDNIFRNFCIGK